MGKKMNFMPNSRISDSPSYSGRKGENVICPGVPVIRRIPLVEEPPTICLSESNFSSSARNEAVGFRHLHKIAGRAIESLSRNDDHPEWVVEFMKRSSNPSKGKRGTSSLSDLQKKISSNSIWKFLI